MPEGDTIYRSAAALRTALAGKQLVSFELRRSPRGRRPPEPGTTIVDVTSAGKHLLVHFDDGNVLHTHMQMTGAWHVYRAGERWRRPGHTARVVLAVADGTVAVCFAAPLVELRLEQVRGQPENTGDGRSTASKHATMRKGVPTFAAATLDRLGPDLCDADPDFAVVLTRLRGIDPATEIGAALLDQHVAAGIGNVYKSEICWFEKVSPFAPIAGLDETGRRRLFETGHTLLRANLDSSRRVTYNGGLAVYGRAGQRCPRCRDWVRRTRVNEVARVSFWCPTCQPQPATA